MDLPNEPIDILLIEDNPGDAHLIEDYLLEVDSQEFKISWVETLQAATITCQSKQYQVILADMGLPDSQGLDTIRSIKAMNPNTPLVVLTGNTDQETGLEAVKIGAQDFLVKSSVNGEAIHRVLRYAIERHQIELQLRLSEAKYRSMVETIGLGVYLIDTELNIIEVNQQLKEWFPRIPFNQGAKCYHVFGVELQSEPCSQCPAVKVLQEGTVTEKVQQALSRGKQRTFRITSSPIRDKTNAISGTLNIVDDITERNQMEQRLHQAQKMEAVGQLAGGIAHDFNNVLQAITGFAELAFESLPARPAVSKKCIEDVLSSTKRASELTSQLLAYGRQQVLKLERVNLNTIIEPVLNMLSRVLGNHITMKLLLNEKPLFVKVDKGQMGQVFMNLCINARDAMTNGGEIVIETGIEEVLVSHCQQSDGIKPGNYAVFTVSDSGCGIAADQLKHIFEPFYTTKKLGEGTGLGLATVYGIIEQHKGLITAESIEGVGTKFTGYLPLLESTSVNSQAQFPPVRSIVLIDSDPDLRKLTQKLLTRNSYSVETISNTPKAIDECLQNIKSLDAIIVSPILSDSPVEQTVKKFKLAFPGIKTLLVSDGLLKQIDRAFAQHESIPILTKPYNSQDLLKIVSHLFLT